MGQGRICADLRKSPSPFRRGRLLRWDARLLRRLRNGQGMRDLWKKTSGWL